MNRRSFLRGLGIAPAFALLPILDPGGKPVSEDDEPVDQDNREAFMLWYYFHGGAEKGLSWEEIAAMPVEMRKDWMILLTKRNNFPGITHLLEKQGDL